MHVGGFSCSYLMAFCTCIVLVMGEPDSSVDQMNRLLEFPGWKALDKLVVMRGSKHYVINDLLSPEDGERIVTAKNVDLKIVRAYHFLTCEFCRTLTTYCNYEMGLAHQCSYLPGIYDQLRCLLKFQNSAKEGVPLIQRMKSALSHLHGLLSDDPVHKNHFTEILRNLEQNFFEATVKKIKKNSTGSNRDLVLQAVNYLKDTIEKHLLPFFKERCLVRTTEEDNVNAFMFNWANNSICPVKEMGTHLETAMNYIAVNLRQKINRFVADFESMGFEYDSTGSKKTPKTIESTVYALNELLAHDGWQRPDDLCIVYKGKPYDRQQVLSVSSDENVDRKLRQTHQLLCCQKAKFLIDYFVFHEDIGNHCLEMKDARNVLECQRLFVETIKNVVLAVTLMRTALLYFYRLSPRTAFNKTVSDILDQLASNVELVLLKRPANAGEGDLLFSLYKETLHVQTITLTIKHYLVEFFQNFCWPAVYLEKLTFLDKGNTADVRLMRVSNTIATNLKKRLHEFIQIDFPSLGFVYDPFLNTVSVLSKQEKTENNNGRTSTVKN